MNIHLFEIGLVLATFVLIALGREYPENLSDYPFAVSITITSNGRVERTCTGAILSENTVLTSGRCVYVDENPIVSGYVRAGADIIDSDGDVFPIKKIYLHRKFTNQNYAHNVALLKVYNFFGFSTYINSLPVNWDFLFEPTEVSVVGYMNSGYEHGTPSLKTVHEFATTIIDTEWCRKTYKAHGNELFIHSETICVRRSENRLFCELTPGAVLIQKNKLIGVLAYHLNNCANSADDGILFTLISHYTNWINKVINPQIYGNPE